MPFWRASWRKSMAAKPAWQHHVDLVLRRLQAGREFRDNLQSSVGRDREKADFLATPHDTFRNSADTLPEEQSTLTEQALGAAFSNPQHSPEDAVRHPAWGHAPLVKAPGPERDADGLPGAPIGSPETGLQHRTVWGPFADPHLPRVYPGSRVILQQLPPPPPLAVMSDVVSGLAALFGWRRRRRRLPKTVAWLSRSLWIAGSLLYGCGRIASGMSLLRSHLAASGNTQAPRLRLWRGFLSIF